MIDSPKPLVVDGTSVVKPEICVNTVDNKSRGTVDFYDDPALDSNKLRDGAHIK